MKQIVCLVVAVCIAAFPAHTLAQEAEGTLNYADHAVMLRQLKEIDDYDLQNIYSYVLFEMSSRINYSKEEINHDEFGELPYKQYLRTPESYYGQQLKVSGSVLQVLKEEKNSDNSRDYSLLVLNDEEQVVCVKITRHSGNRILPDDGIVVYGVGYGVHNYTTRAKTDASVPTLFCKGCIITEN